MGKTAKKFGRELKRRIDFGDQLAPLLAGFTLNMSVKRSIDLTAIEVLSEKLEWMLLFVESNRIDDSLPIFVGETGGADQDVSAGRHAI